MTDYSGMVMMWRLSFPAGPSRKTFGAFWAKKSAYDRNNFNAFFTK